MPAPSVSAAASSGVANSSQRAVSVRASSLSRMGRDIGVEEPAHPLPKTLAPRLFRGDEGREPAAADGGDAIGDREQLIEILGDDENRGALVAQSDERTVDRGGGADVDAPGRVRRGQQFRVLQHLTAEDELL